MATDYGSFEWPPGIAAGGSGVVSLNGLTGVLSLVAGSGITLTPSGSTITIASSGSSGANTSLSNLSATALNTQLNLNTQSIVDTSQGLADIPVISLNGGAPAEGGATPGEIDIIAGTGANVIIGTATLSSVITVTDASPLAILGATGVFLDGGAGVVAFNTNADLNANGIVNVNSLAIIGTGASVTLRGPSSATTAYTLFLPATQGAAGTVLTNNGSGHLSWTTPGAGSVTSVSVVSANGFAGTVATSTTTPAITLSTSVTGILQGNGTAISAASTTGSGNVVLATSPTLSSPVVGTQATTDNSTLAASTAYVTTAVANAVSGVNPAVAVQAATTLASNTSSYTYNNGVSGVGATLTGPTNTALTVDGFTFTALGQRILVKNDTQSPSGAFNGVYLVTQLQTSLLGVVLTRALDYDQPSDINNTGAIPVVNGTINASTSWVQTAQVTTVGTSPLVFAQFSLNPSTVLVNPMTTLGDTIYENATPAPARLAGNTTASLKFLSQVGTGSASAAPTWAFPLSVNTTPKTATYAVLDGDSVIYLNPSGGAFTVTMPSPTSIAGQSFTFVVTTAGTGTNCVTLAANSGETFGAGALASLHMSTLGEVYTLVSDGTNWVVDTHFTETAPVAFTMNLFGATTNPTKGTVVTDRAVWWREGNMMHINWYFLQSAAGSGGSGVVGFAMPTGFTINTTLQPASTTAFTAVGCSDVSFPGWVSGFLPIGVYNSSNLTAEVSGAPSTSGNGPNFGATGTSFMWLQAVVPIANWEA
jgi:hypothetical protein